MINPCHCVICLQLSTAQESFQQTIEALSNELEMIRNHKDAIEQQLDEVEKPTGHKSSSQSRRSVTFSSKQSKPASNKGWCSYPPPLD